jgi:hypothetical protein
MALKNVNMGKISRAFQVKEENTKVSLALKKAVAEATLCNPAKINNFNLIKRSSNSSGRSYLSSSYTVDSVTATATTSATNQRTELRADLLTGDPLQHQLKKEQTTLAIHTMNM